MKLRAIIGSAVFIALWTAQTAVAWHDPSLGRWVTRDLIDEPGFQLLQGPGAHAYTATPSFQQNGRWMRRAPVPSDASGIGQRKWIVRDIESEANLYLFVRNSPISSFDALGLQMVGPPGSGLPSWPGPPASSPSACRTTCKQEENRCRVRATVICIGVGIITETGPVGGGVCLATYWEFCKEKYRDSCVDTPSGPYLLPPYN
jgi:hypothetical protein